MTRMTGPPPRLPQAGPEPGACRAVLDVLRASFERSVDLGGDDFLVLLQFPHALLGPAMARRGTLDTLAALAASPVEAAAALEKETATCVSLAREIADWNEVRAVLFMDDIAGNAGPWIAPETLRALYFPRLRQVFDVFASKHIPVLFHSDGDLASLHRDILASGAAGHHPVEPVGNWNLRAASGGPPGTVVIGNASIGKLSMSVEGARAERDRCLAFASEHAAYFQAPASEIGPALALEHVLAFFDPNSAP
jgi:hypothetical protein